MGAWRGQGVGASGQRVRKREEHASRSQNRRRAAGTPRAARRTERKAAGTQLGCVRLPLPGSAVRPCNAQYRRAHAKVRWRPLCGVKVLDTGPPDPSRAGLHRNVQIGTPVERSEAAGAPRRARRAARGGSSRGRWGRRSGPARVVRTGRSQRTALIRARKASPITLARMPVELGS